MQEVEPESKAGRRIAIARWSQLSFVPILFTAEDNTEAEADRQAAVDWGEERCPIWTGLCCGREELSL